MLLSSQDAPEFTPRNQEPASTGYSPRRKKNRGINFHFEPADSTASFDIKGFFPRDENEIPTNGVILSQESISFSQMSQDFAERLGQMNMKDEHSAFFSANDDSFLLNEPSKFAIPTAPLSQKLRLFGQQQKQPNRIFETERQFDIRPCSKNHFISKTADPTEAYFANTRSCMRKINKIWVSAFKERSRYVTEFEELTLLGEGTFSAVFCSRHRLDGKLYAIKKLKQRIHSENQSILLLREACALAALQDCPQIVKYHTCWIEEQQLYLQLEVCDIGSLEDLITFHAYETIVAMTRNTHQGLGSGSAPATQNSDPGLMGNPMNSATNNSYRNILSFNNMPMIDVSYDRRNRSDSVESDMFLLTPTVTQGKMIESTVLPHSGPQSATNAAVVSESMNVNEGIDERVAWTILRDIATALVFMHKKRKFPFLRFECKS
jgi:hypothetical protein